MNNFQAHTSTDNLLENAAAAAGNATTHAAQQADQALQSGMQTVRQTAEQLRKQAAHANDVAMGYIRQEPIKAVLIAAATGATLMALVGLMGRSRQRD